jgi:hypothetical protein
VHLVVAKVLTRLLFSVNLAPLRDRALAQIDDEADPEADPDDRVLYARTVAGGWAVAGLSCGLATVALAFVGRAFAGNSGRTVGLAVGLGATAFCLSGSLYASWRMFQVYHLRGVTRRHGDGLQVARAARRATLRNTSLIGQAVVAALAIVLASGA